MISPEQIIQLFQLQPHPKEGGFFRETYRSEEQIAPQALPARYQGPRCHGTAIYYLLTPNTFSALHRLASDEIFHFYLGDPVRMLQLHPQGRAETLILGQDVVAGQQLQVLAPRNVWQGSHLLDGGRFALLGCTVAPGFEYQDYEHGVREQLVRDYPSQEELIRRLTM
jgi:hypothetical protein